MPLYTFLIQTYLKMVEILGLQGSCTDGLEKNVLHKKWFLELAEFVP